MSEKNSIYTQLLFGTFFWGINFHLAQIATSYMSPMAASAARYLFAGMGMVLLYRLYGKKNTDRAMKRKAVLQALPIIMVCLSGVFFFNYFFFKGLSMTLALNGALIVGLNPVFTLVFAVLMIRIPVLRRQVIGIVLSLLGVTVVITQGNLFNVLSLSVNMGDVYILIACLLFAFHNVLIQKYLSWINPVFLTLITTVLGAVLFFVFSAPEWLAFNYQTLDSRFWWAVALMGLAGTTLSFTFWNTGVKNIGADKTALFLNLVPIFAAVSGLYFDQPITLPQIAGGVLIGLGIQFAVRKKVPIVQ